MTEAEKRSQAIKGAADVPPRTEPAPRKPQPDPKHQTPDAPKPHPAPETAGPGKCLTKKEAKRRCNQMLVCWIFAAVMILITLTAAALAIRAPFFNGPEFTEQDMLYEMAYCCIAFAAGLIGKWTIRNAIL